MIFVKEATRAEIAAFAKKTRELQKKVGKLDDDAVKKAFTFLSDARMRIADSITQAQGFDQFHLVQLLQSVENAMEEFRQRYSKVVLPSIRDGFNGGHDLVDLPMIEAGIRISPRPLMDLNQIEFMQDFSASLIGKASKQAIWQIDSILRLAIIGEKSPNEVMREIGLVLRKRTAAEVERIVRTEINRSINLGEEIRTQQIKDQVKGLKKYWRHTNDSRTRDTHIEVGRATNPDYGGMPIDVDDDYDVGGYSAKYPMDVTLPASEVINCRCRNILTIVDIE